MNEIKQRLIDHDQVFEIIRRENIRLHEEFIATCLQELAADGIDIPAYDYCRVELDATWAIGCDSYHYLADGIDIPAYDYCRVELDATIGCASYHYLVVNGKQFGSRKYIGHVASHDVSIYVVSQGYDRVMFILDGKQK